MWNEAKFVFKFFAAIIVAFIWFYLIVVQLPILLTSGTMGWFAGNALVVLSVFVPVYMIWKIFKALSNKTINKE